MNPSLHLIITTPDSVLVDDESALSVRATDASGSFGILSQHTDMVSVLVDSVIRWRSVSDTYHYCAVRRGVLTVEQGDTVRIACREGLRGERLSDLEIQVRELRARETDADREETVRQTKLHAQAMRQILFYLNRANGSTLTPNGSQLKR